MNGNVYYFSRAKMKERKTFLEVKGEERKVSVK